MSLTAKQTDFIASDPPATPYLLVDLDQVAENYAAIAGGFEDADVFYAMKANPAPEILDLLVRAGSCFDCASLNEVRQALAAGATPDRIAFGNTIKKSSEIAGAHALGVRRFAFDCEVELRKIADHAPGAAVWCRLLTEGDGADWPLSRKFGCDEAMAEELMTLAPQWGLEPAGLSFHVGSQQRNPEGWDKAIETCARLWQRLAAIGVEMHTLNLGGGLPSTYREAMPTVPAYANAIRTSLTRHFGNHLPALMVEPGRAMVGNAGIIEAEVVLISRKSANDNKHWVFLDIGKFGGLAETMEEAIRYRISSHRTGDAMPVIIAGPTCDSADILYESTPYHLPSDLQVGDRVRIHGTGAYTTTYSSVAFNGFEPLRAYFV